MPPASGRGPFQGVIEFFMLVTRFVFAGAVPLMAWLAGTFFLLVPKQTTDLLAQSNLWQQLTLFPLAVGLWAFTCWFWTRWGVNLQPMNWPETPLQEGNPTKHTLVRVNDVQGAGRLLRLWLPRLPLLGSLPVAFISCWRTEPPFSHGWWYSILPVGGVLLVMELWFWRLLIRSPRRQPAATWIGRLTATTADRLRDMGEVTSPPRSGGTFGVWTCLDRLPLGRWSFLWWLTLFFGIAAGVTFAPVGLAHVVGAPAATFFCLAAVTGLVAFPSVLIRRVTGLPGTLVLAAWVTLITQVNGNHRVRTIESDPIAIDREPPESLSPVAITTYPLPARRPTLAQALDAWLVKCNNGDSMSDIVLVATAGGASRAALWTASVLRTIEQSVKEQRFQHALFAISGVSGGSLGAAAYVAALPPGGCTANQDAEPKQRWDRERTALRTEFLSPPLVGYLSTDVLASFLPLLIKDRAAALELAWERAWANAWNLSATPPIMPAGAFDRSFLSLWLQGGQTRPSDGAPDPAWNAAAPLLFFNGTHANSGFPIITAPVKVTRDAFPLALDFLDIVGRDIRLSTAVTNSARFPVVSPGGVLTNRDGDYEGYVMDGGYVENYGADTVRDLVRDIDAYKTIPEPECTQAKCGPRVAVIQISSDPSLPADLLSRCTKPPALALSPDRVAAPVQVLADLLGPLFTVLEARGARGARTAGDLMRAKCPRPGPEPDGVWPGRKPDGVADYFHFGLCDEDIPGKGRQSDVVGLNWALTNGAADFLAPENVTMSSGKSVAIEADGKSFAMTACGNLDELQRLVEWFNPQPVADPTRQTVHASQLRE